MGNAWRNFAKKNKDCLQSKETLKNNNGHCFHFRFGLRTTVIPGRNCKQCRRKIWEGGGGGWDKQSVLQAMRKREMAGLISTYSCNLFISVATLSTCMFRP